MAQARVRQNYLAIAAAAVASFIFEAVWYSLFLQTWLNGIGRSRDWLMHSGMNEYLQYAVALVCAAGMAAAISCITQLTGEQTAVRGMQAGALLWLGFVATTWTTEYIFEIKPLSLFGVNVGFWLLDMLLMGAIVGWWRKKALVAKLVGQPEKHAAA